MVEKQRQAAISEGLGVQPIMINSALVSAQNRKRLYWTNIPNVGQLEDKGILLKDVLESGQGIECKPRENTNIVITQNSIRCQMKDKKKSTAQGTSVFFETSKSNAIIVAHTPMVIQSITAKKTPQHININPSGNGMNGDVITTDRKSRCLTTNKGEGPKIFEPVCVAQRGRYIESDNRSKKVGGGTYQAIEPRNDGKTNALTTVQKDNMICEAITNGSAKRIIKQTRTENEKAMCLTATCYKGTASNGITNIPIKIGEYGKGGQGQRIYSVVGKTITLTTNSGGMGGTTGLYKIDLPDGDYIIRKLTPIEAERLQTLPDDYTAAVSNTQRYKGIGNGWTVDVIAHILSHIPEVTPYA